jgi:DNA-binding transcriptional LysR family regulator
MGKLLVAEGLGAAVLPDYAVKGDPLERSGLIAFRPIAGEGTAVSMHLLRRRAGRPPAPVADLAAHLKEQAGRA